jgi:hypothetical protein
MTVQPTTAVKDLINKLIVDYKACGYWDLCDVIVKFNLFDAQAGLLDLKNYKDATAVNSPTFTKYYGYEGDAVTKYINSNYKPSVDGVKYSVYDAHFYRDFHTTSINGGLKFDGGGNGVFGVIATSTNSANYLHLQRMNTTGAANMGGINVGSNFISKNNSTHIESWSEGTKFTTTVALPNLTSGWIYLFGCTWNLGDTVQYLNNHKLRGYSLGAYVSDEIKVAVKAANDYFNTNIINAY